MKKSLRKALSLLLVPMFLLPLGLMTVSATNGNYTIESPYKDVQWGTWGAYKGNLHTHSTYSDASTSMTDMVTEHYEQGFDFMAMSEHGITGKAWNQKPDFKLIYAYQDLTGAPKSYLTDAQFTGITAGTYPLAATNAARGKGMTCVTGANELNAVVLTKSHVNGYFLPEGTHDKNFIGYENGHEQAVKLVDEVGGLSHINHPGDWLESSGNIKAVLDPANVAYFGDILLKYDSCLGIEAMNGQNANASRYDRVLWDQLLMYTLPYGKTVMGFANNDAHKTHEVDTAFGVYMMAENTPAKVRETMQSGAFFSVGRKLHANDIIGPAESFDVNNQKLPYPMFKDIQVEPDGRQITAHLENWNYIQWIANGKVIKTTRNQVMVDTPPDRDFINLEDVEGLEDVLYIRAELYGDGGVCLTQAFVINNGTAPKKYEPETGFPALWKKIVFWLKSRYVYVLIQELVRLINK